MFIAPEVTADFADPAGSHLFLDRAKAPRLYAYARYAG